MQQSDPLLDDDRGHSLKRVAKQLIRRPGRYHFGDFLRFGLPVTLVAGLAAPLVLPLACPSFCTSGVRSHQECRVQRACRGQSLEELGSRCSFGARVVAPLPPEAVDAAPVPAPSAGAGPSPYPYP